MTPEEFLNKIKTLLLPDELKMAVIKMEYQTINFYAVRRIAKLIFEMCYTWQEIDYIQFYPYKTNTLKASLTIFLREK